MTAAVQAQAPRTAEDYLRRGLSCHRGGDLVRRSLLQPRRGSPTARPPRRSAAGFRPRRPSRPEI